MPSRNRHLCGHFPERRGQPRLAEGARRQEDGPRHDAPQRVPRTRLGQHPDTREDGPDCRGRAALGGRDPLTESDGQGRTATSHRSVPVWITSLAFIAANLGAQEVVGMCASGAKYGWMTAHFYWVGAVPAMLFIGVFMMPLYY